MNKALFALALLAACGGDTTNVIDTTPGDVGGDENPDTTGPLIVHPPIETSQPLGEDVVITATVTDEESAVFIVEINYKEETSTTWTTGHKLNLQNAESGEYSGVIPAADVHGGGMNYYIRAVDSSNNESNLPENGDYHFRINGG